MRMVAEQGRAVAAAGHKRKVCRRRSSRCAMSSRLPEACAMAELTLCAGAKAHRGARTPELARHGSCQSRGSRIRRSCQRWQGTRGRWGRASLGPNTMSRSGWKRKIALILSFTVNFFANVSRK